MIPPSRARGNAILYVLIAVLLLGAITFAVSQNGDTNPGNDISATGDKASATQILGYESQAQTAVNRMVNNGIDIDSIDYTLPSGASFNTAPTDVKLFHPDGGGLQWKALPSKASGAAVASPVNGYYIGRYNNFEWTPTTAKDVIFTVWGISQNACAELDRKITGSTAIPTVSSPDIRQLLLDTSIGGSSNVDFLITYCASCNEKPALCISNGSAPALYAYYSIISPR